MLRNPSYLPQRWGFWKMKRTQLKLRIIHQTVFREADEHRKWLDKLYIDSGGGWECDEELWKLIGMHICLSAWLSCDRMHIEEGTFHWPGFQARTSLKRDVNHITLRAAVCLKGMGQVANNNYWIATTFFKRQLVLLMIKKAYGRLRDK